MLPRSYSKTEHTSPAFLTYSTTSFRERGFISLIEALNSDVVLIIVILVLEVQNKGPFLA